MANLPETATWEAGIFQLETTTPALGGVDGPANAQAKALANRTSFLKQEVEGVQLRQDLAIREAVMRDDQGRVHHMVWIPRFRVAANSIGGVWPPADLEMGGFFVDKYTCSHPLATPAARGVVANKVVLEDSVDDVAVARPGVVPWDEIELYAAKNACANRKFGGVSCHLVTPDEWGAILMLLLRNPEPRGSNYQRRDSRDPDVWENRGVADPTNVDRCLVGTGPVTWAHNGAPDGIFDLIGSPQMVDMEIHAGRYVHLLGSTISDAGGILAGDSSITITNPQRIEHWPAADGFCAIRSYLAEPQEYIRYTALVDNGDGTWTLTGCARGQRGTAAAAHSDGVTLDLRIDYCLIPGGASGYLDDAGLDNDTDASSTFALREVVLGPGSAGLQVGSVLDCEGERMQVTAVAEVAGVYTITATRGYGGTVKAAHADGKALAMLSPSLDIDVHYGVQRGWPSSLRTEAPLLGMVLPGVSTAAYDDEASFDGIVWCALAYDAVGMRGGWSIYTDLPYSYAGWDFGVVEDTDGAGGLQPLQFRAAFTVE